MRPSQASEPRGSDLHTRAHGAADTLLEPYEAGRVPEDVRTVVGYYFACLLAADRAANQLLVYAASVGGGR